MPLNTVDVSNWSTPLTADALTAWKALGIELVIVQAVSPGPGYPPCVDQQQAQAILGAGLKLGVYVYAWTGTPQIAKDNATRFASYGFPVERWWADCEDASTASPQQRETVVADLLVHLDTLGGHRPAGAYSGLWWVSGYLPANSQVFAGRDIWVSLYNGVDTVDAPALCGGNVVMHQFAGTSTLSGVQNVDLNVAAESEFSDFPNVPPDPIPPDDPCAEVTAKRDSLIVTVADIADRLGDLILAEANYLKRPMRRWYIRSIVAQMAAERSSSIGPRP